MTVKVITGADPAAGVEISETVPAGRAWELLAVRFTLVTSATAATRQVQLVLQNDSSVEFLRIAANVTQIASLTNSYNFAAGLGYERSALVQSHMVTGLPRLVLPGGYKITTVTASVQAGDNYGAPLLYVVERPLAAVG